MKSKLEQLREKEKKLAKRLDQTMTEQDEIKSRMITDRLHKAGALSSQWATLGIEIESLRESLTRVHTQVEAEMDRINSPDMQKMLHRG